MIKAKILAVDDEDFNLDILNEHLIDEGFEVIQAVDGLDGLEKLKSDPEISVIVLDRMMPKMDGMEFLHAIKAMPEFAHIPIIMQTAAASSQQVLEGIQAGAYYYLTKPYQSMMLVSIVKAAFLEAQNRRIVQDEMQNFQYARKLMDKAIFRFQTLEEAKQIAYFIASCTSDPMKYVYGLTELMVNAVEHGNLGIQYHEKKNLVLAGSWISEIDRRLSLHENQEKYAYAEFENISNGYMVRIIDQGTGFDWKNYLEFSPDRVTDPNGRGIATAKMLSFEEMEFIGCGNEVICRF